MHVNTMHFCATGTISSVTGTRFDLRSDVQIGTVLDKSSSVRGINATYCLRGPTGSRLAARFAFISQPYFPYFGVFSSHLSVSRHRGKCRTLRGVFFYIIMLRNIQCGSQYGTAWFLMSHADHLLEIGCVQNEKYKVSLQILQKYQ